MKKLIPQEIIDQHQSSPKSLLLKSSTLVLNNIRSAFNVGNLFRTADAVGIGDIILSGFTPKPPHRNIIRASLSAENSIPWVGINRHHDLIQTLTLKNYITVAFEQTNDSINLFDLNLDTKKNYCFILGNEVFGISNELLDIAEIICHIPQVGIKHSLNVAVAGSVALYILYGKTI